MPRDKEPGDEAFSGTLNGNGLLHISVTRAGQETTLSRVIRLVEEARENGLVLADPPFYTDARVAERAARLRAQSAVYARDSWP